VSPLGAGLRVAGTWFDEHGDADDGSAAVAVDAAAQWASARPPYVQLHTADPGPAEPRPGVVTFAAPDVAPAIVLAIDAERAMFTLRVLMRMVERLDAEERARRREQRRIGLMYRHRQLARRRRHRNR